MPIEGYNMAISACERLNDLDRAIGYYEVFVILFSTFLYGYLCL